MITHTKRVLPGMLMSLLLSVPAWAAPAADGQTPDGKTTHFKAGAKSAVAHKPLAKPAGTKAAAAKPVHRPVVSHGATPARPKREVTPALSQGSNGRIIRRVALASGGKFDHSLIDDGTMWREQGSMVTWQQTGMASWYGGQKWQGHQTSSGERYDQNQLTAAHATLPLGTKVRVVRADGAKAVIVTINDRPGTRTRIIDLSREAAKELGILASGTVMVTLQPM
jgi:rare lipoprotein A